MTEGNGTTAESKQIGIERIDINREGVTNIRATFYREGEDYGVGLSGDTAATEVIRPYLQKAPNVETEAPCGDKAAAAMARWNWLKGELRTDGFTITDVPFPSYKMTISVDLASGHILAPPAEGLTGDEPRDKSIEESIFASVARALRGIGEDVVSKIKEAVADGKHDDAARIFLERTDAVCVQFNARELLGAVTGIDLDSLSHIDAASVLFHRVGIRTLLGAYDSEMGADVSLLLGSFADQIPPERMASLRTACGLVELHEGNRESAFGNFKGVAESTDDVSSADRAWAYRNLSMMLDCGDPEAARYAELSADAFLSCGNRMEAAKSVVRLAKCILPDAPDQALQRLDEVIAWFADSDPISAEKRAGLYHLRADALLRLGRAKEAATAAKLAADERAELHGAELARAASLTLAGIAAAQAGEEVEAATLDDMAKSLRSEHWRPGDLHDELQRAIEFGDRDSIERVREDAKSRGEVRIAALASIWFGIRGGDDGNLLKVYEVALQSLIAANAKADDIAVAELAVGNRLLELDEAARALSHFEHILRLDPLHHVARQNYAAILWKLEKWSEAAAFFAKELIRFPDRPGLLYGLGRSLFEAGRPGEAVYPLLKASRILENQGQQKDHVESMLTRAMASNPHVEFEKQTPQMPPVTRRELEACLSSLREFIQAHKRMIFWRSIGDGKHKWVESPERVAQDLVHTFIKARFGERIHVFEELDCGAGRLDVYVMAIGGLSAVLELKMLGHPYTSPYAFSGKEQIAHYMEQRKSHIGYLLIFDGRARDFGKGLNSVELVGTSTVMVSFIDLRRTVKGDASEPSD